MEGWLGLCSIALSMLLALLFLKPSGGKKQQPPGPWNLPIIGSLHHFVKHPPHRALMELSRKHGPLMLLKLGEVPTLVVSGAEVAAVVMKTHDLSFAGRPESVTQKIFGCGGKGIALAPYGDHWSQMRKICAVDLLSSNQVRRFEGIRLEEVGNLLQIITASASTGATINISKKMVELSNDVVCRAVFGGKVTHQKEYLRELDTSLVLLGGFCLVDLFPSSRLVRWLSNVECDMRKSCGRIHRIIASTIEERRVVRAAGEEADEDLLDVLLRLQQEDVSEFPLTTEMISTVLFDVFAGATETTGGAMEWTMSELVRNQEVMAKAQQEVREVIGQDRDIITDNDLVKPPYLMAVIKEVFRLHPPVSIVPRMAREDCAIMSYDIPKGTPVYINVFAVCRDPSYWNNPEEFRPERFDGKNVNYNGTQCEFPPFGAGRRQCPGIKFATSLLEVALANLLYHFDWILPDGSSPSSVDMSEKFGMSVNRRYDLQLRAFPHSWTTTTPLK